MKTRNMLIATSVAMGLGLGAAANVQATPILGSHVDSALFATAIGSTTGWAFLGASTSAFVVSGTAELEYRSSSYDDSFGYSSTAHTNRVTVFSNSAAVGATAAVAGYSPSYLLYFAADGADSFSSSDDNRQYTDGFASGNTPGITQGDIDIFYNAALSKWALFYDDAGGGNGISGDDGDYNDMVVSFTSTAVPEPTTLGLLGLSLLGLGMLRRRKGAQGTQGELAA